MSETLIQRRAAEASKHIETRTRPDGKPFVCCTDTAPEWVKELVHDAHGTMGPDDFRYVFIAEALDALESEPDPDDIMPEADIYTSDLCEWLGSRVDRYSYIDEYRDECGHADSIIGEIQGGQVREKEEVLASVRSSLEELSIDCRPYAHPGKFEGGLLVDEWAYGASCEGLDDECGSVTESGAWYGLLRGPFKTDPPFSDVVLQADLTADEKSFLRLSAGAIISENSQGFISVEWFDEADDLNAKWDEIQADLESADDD